MKIQLTVNDGWYLSATARGTMWLKVVWDPLDVMYLPHCYLKARMNIVYI